jgi:peroxiredoxin
MADITTTAFGIGDPVPPFSLPDTDGVAHAVPQDPAPAATVIAVTCNHCPHVIAWNPHVRRVAEEYRERGVRFLAINANDSSRYPADSLEAMQRFVRDQRWPIPYLHDEAQDVARALGAQVTPHVFVLDGEHRLVYRGAPGSEHEDAEWLRAALDAALAGAAPAEAETRPRGCSVKWRA